MAKKAKKKRKSGPKPKPHGKLKSRIVVFIENERIEARGGEEAMQEHLYLMA